VTYTVSWQASGDAHTVAVAAAVNPGVDLNALALAAVLSPILDVAALAARGGLSGPAFDPRDAVVQVLEQRVVGGRNVEWILSVQKVAPRLLQHLLGAMAFFDRAIAPLSTLAVAAPQSFVQALQSAEQGYWKPLPFQYTDQRQHFVGGLTVYVDFTHSISLDARAKFEDEAFGDWFCAASAGCFCDQQVPPELARIYLGEARYWADGMALSLDEFIQAEPVAIDSLIDVFTRAHYEIASIQSVEIDDG
jgi:hypothetical protein